MRPALVIGGALRVLNAAASRVKLATAKPSIDVASLRLEHEIASFPLDYDQQQLGSCGPNGLAENYEFRLGAKFSRLFAYYFTRAAEGDALADDGVTIPDLLDVARAMGMPHEDLWPYAIERFQVAPPHEVLRDAAQHRLERDDVIADLDHLLHELDAEQPVMFGFKVPRSMEDGSGSGTASTGIVNVPSESDPVAGGHCVNAIGFSRPRRMIKCTSHYGRGYGDSGALWLPFEMWTSGNVMDMRALRSIT